MAARELGKEFRIRIDVARRLGAIAIRTTEDALEGYWEEHDEGRGEGWQELPCYQNDKTEALKLFTIMSEKRLGPELSGYVPSDSTETPEEDAGRTYYAHTSDASGFSFHESIEDSPERAIALLFIKAIEKPLQSLDRAFAMDYIRQTYNVPAKIGGKVKFGSNKGMIIGADGAHLIIDVDGKVGRYHPEWHLNYLDAEETS